MVRLSIKSDIPWPSNSAANTNGRTSPKRSMPHSVKAWTMSSCLDAKSSLRLSISLKATEHS